MQEDERLEFCSCWHYRREWNENDTEILEILMQDGNDRLWKTCPFAFTKHPDRDRAVTFLVERLQDYDGGYEPLNYFQALGIMKDQRAAAAIRPYYERYRQAMKAESVVGVPDDIYRGPIPYFPYLCACGALVKVDGDPSTSKPFVSISTILTSKFDGGPSTHWKLKGQRQPKEKLKTRGSTPKGDFPLAEVCCSLAKQCAVKGAGLQRVQLPGNRVAGPHCWRPALSEPDVTVSRHPAQAL
jgi:hypothetical protein